MQMQQIPIIETLFFDAAVRAAKNSLCLRDRCGAVIALAGVIIGTGYNAPPRDDISNRKCYIHFPANSRKSKSDRTCCVHAEIRAILMAQKTIPDLRGSVLYFARVDDHGEMCYSSEPYCTLCSRFALDTGISFWALWHTTGPRLYDAKMYNDLSYQFHQKP
jgi:deoxycytidylate deaminase